MTMHFANYDVELFGWISVSTWLVEFIYGDESSIGW